MAHVSMNPETFVEGGGLANNFDGTITKSRFVMFDYDGTVKPGVPSWELEVEIDETEEKNTEHYSCGSAKSWSPSEDGNFLEPIGNDTAIRNSCKFAVAMRALVEVGGPIDAIDKSGIGVLEGARVHMVRVPTPETGLEKSAKQKEREKKFGPDTMLVISEIIALAGEKKAAKASKGAPAKAGKGKSAPSKQEAPAATDGGEAEELEEKAVMAVLEVLGKESPVPVAKMTPKIFLGPCKADPAKLKIVKIVADPSFNERHADMWAFDGKEYSTLLE